MRLTLRTLLAYLDGNLQPDDAEDIGKKIEESEFATTLVHRIRDVTRRLRLGVPPVVGRGLGADPNTVAEYLEYRLADERVPELETICLESDVNLAEVAACHQILTLVLGEPAEIDPQTRQRLYGLANHVDAPPVQSDAHQPATAGFAHAAPVSPTGKRGSAAAAASPQHLADVGAPALGRRPKPEVPAYLRESRSKLWPLLALAAMVVVTALVTFGGLLAFGPPELRERLTAFVSSPAATDTETPDESAPPAETSPESATGEMPAADGAAPGTASTDPDATGSTEATASTEAPPAGRPEATIAEKPPLGAGTPIDPATDTQPEPGAEGSPIRESDTQGLFDPAGETSPAAANPADGFGTPSVLAPGKMPAESPTDPKAPEPLDPRAARPLPSNPPLPGGTEPAEATPPNMPETDLDPSVPVPTVAGLTRPTSTPGSGGTPGAGKEPGTTREPAGAAATREADNESFGRFTSKLEVLLKLDAKSGDWLRLPTMAPLSKGDRLLSLPSFHPTVTLSSNINLQAEGASMFELTGWTNDGVPIVTVEFGRLLMLTVGKAGNSLVLKIDGHEFLITFVDAESNLALDVRRELPPGQNPEKGAAPMVAHLYATSGLIRVTEANTPPEELQAPSQRALAGPAIPAGADVPTWVTSETQSNADALARKVVEPAIKPEQPAALQLQELADPTSRKREVRSLAARSLAYLDNFEPCLAALNDSKGRLNWGSSFDGLREAVARSPETATKVRKTIEKQRGNEAASTMFRALWGYSVDDLKRGSDKDLVAGLKNDSLDIRVTSFLTLQRIDGGATHGYSPEDGEAKRRGPYNTWSKKVGKLGQPPAGTTKGKSAAKGG